MAILSFDVGQKNLAYCVAELNKNEVNDSETVKINKWDIIDISFDNNSDEDLNNFIQNYKKMKIDVLRNNMVKYGMKIGLLKKKELLKMTEDYFINNGLLKKKLTILDISTILIKKLDKLDILNGIDTVLIENQPCMKNPTMKSIQMVLYSYFIIRGFIDNNTKNETNETYETNETIESNNYKLKTLRFISAKNKLKKCEKIEELKDRTKNYKDRKKLAIEYCSYILNKYNETDKTIFFNSHGKKDDLADCYLQAIYYIDDIIDKNIKEENKIKRKKQVEENKKQKEENKIKRKQQAEENKKQKEENKK